MTPADYAVLIGVGTVVIGGFGLFLTTLGIIFTGIYKFGKVERSLDRCNTDHDKATESRGQMHRDIGSINRRLGELIAELKGKGVLNGNSIQDRQTD